MTRALIVGAPRSGSGKTTVTLGALVALRRRGLRIRGAKSGPDYIDPAFHAAATGFPSLNLDTWAMPLGLVDSLVTDAAEGIDLLIVESAMGLFDGAGGEPGRTGASADLAEHLGIPVVLVMDVSGQSQSAAAVLRGFATHRAGVRVAGVIYNRVASERHLHGIRGAVAELGIPELGAVMRDPSLTLPERHLGLVQAGEHADLAERLDHLAGRMEACLDLDALSALAAPLPSAPVPRQSAVRPPGQRIALARDAAFSFVYPHHLLDWQRAGAEIVPFSPLADEAPPENCDVCWLPGGYPELHAGTLASARCFMEGLRRFAETRPVHGECGGYMVLGRALVDGTGERHAMAGLLDHVTSFAERRMNLGYRAAVLEADAPFAHAGTVLTGHEYHYSRVVEAGSDPPLARVRDGYGNDLGTAGGQRGPVTGTFFHVIAASTG